MANIKPFKAIRPAEKFVSKVAALPYDVMTSDEAREMVKDNPYSFLHVDKAEIDLAPTINIYDEQVYHKAKSNLDQMIANQILITEDDACLYIYRLTMNGKSQTGIVACSKVDDYLENRIKKHELTREDKELDRIKHIEACQAHTGPIFLCYREQKTITDLTNQWIEDHSALYEFTCEDGVGHTVWKIDDRQVIKQYIELFASIESVYIADGHHRTASAVKAAVKKREHTANYTGEEEFNYFLSVIFADNEVQILDYNRVVKDLNGHTSSEILERLANKFNVSEIQSNDCFKPTQPHHFGMYLNSKWYKLVIKEQFINKTDIISSLDVSILQNEVLKPILGIQDIRTDKRIDFVGGIRGPEELKKRVDSGEMQIAFSLYPVSMDQLMKISDADQIMPPKSTWFEPKLRSGIFIHKL